MFGVASDGFVLGTEIQPGKENLHLLRRTATADELVALGHQVVDKVLIDLGQVGLSGQELRKAGGLFERPGHLQLFPVHRTVLPVRRGSAFVQDVAVDLALLEDIRPGAGRLALVGHLTIFIPLRFAEHHHIGSAGIIERDIETGILAVQDDFMIVDHLDALHRTDARAITREGRIFRPG